MNSHRETASDRAYTALLRLYPAVFRARYGRAMRDFHRDRVAVARTAGESMAALWLATVIDVVFSAAAEHLRPFLSGDAVRDTLTHDLAFAVRSLRRRPAFTLIIIATIALGVGANATIFSVVNAILIRPLAYPKPEQLFTFGHEPPQWLTSEPQFVDYTNGMKSLSGLAAYTPRQGTLVVGDAPERIHVVRGSDAFFPVLGVQPLLGRTFADDEFIPRQTTVVILSHALWQRAFGGDTSVIGKKITLEGLPRIVVGVMPASFAFPDERTDAWLPMTRFKADSLGDRTAHYLFLVGRLKTGVTIESARAEARGIARQMLLAYSNTVNPATPLRPVLTSLEDHVVGRTRPFLLALLGAVGFVLLIACANVANLLLVRGEARRKELALRAAIGASNKRIAVQLLTESLLLATTGAALGLLLAWTANRALVAAAPASVPRVADITIDWRVLGFTAAITMLTGVLVGIAPAWRGARADVASTLKEGGKTTSADGSSSLARRTLVVVEMALAVTMLGGAGMLLRSLWHLQQGGLGFDASNVLTAKVSIPAREYDDARAAIFFDQLLERMRALPGVRSAAASGWLPVVDAGGLSGYRPEGGSYPDGQWPTAVPQHATPGYFATIGIPLLEGRDFTRDDRADGELVAIVSRKFADQSWPGVSAIGKRFQMGGPNPPFIRVIGVVGDIRGRGFGDVPEPTMYFPYAQSTRATYYTPRSMGILIRVRDNPPGHAAGLRRAVLALDRTVPVSDIRTLEQVAGLSVAVRTFNTTLLALFAALALVLAGIGTYGVISYGVSQRRFEIGVRMALGAADRSVLALVMTEGMRLAAIGLAIGLVASVALGRVIRAMLVDVPPIDAPSLAFTAVLLAVVAATASLIPALRALRVSPLDALRSQ